MKKKNLEVIVFLPVFCMLVYFFCSKMGTANFFSTIMNTSYKLLIDTVLYLTAIAVLVSALADLFTEFGVINLINKLLSPLMGPIFGMPGASSLGILMTYLSDNPSILAFAENKQFRRHFKCYQLPALTNLGTGFGMGAIITTFVVSLNSPIGESFGKAALIGNIAAFIGSMISCRIMLHFTKKVYGKTDMCIVKEQGLENLEEEKKPQGIGIRIISALLDGGKKGIQIGISITPGVLIICTIVMILTNGPSSAGIYTGSAFEGIPVLPWVGEKLSFILKPLFGFYSSESIGVPITALGAAAAGIGLIPQLLQDGLANAHDVAVFTAMCMCWSGFLSTHIAMMDTLGCKELTGKAILSHTIGGFCAGICANWIFNFF